MIKIVSKFSFSINHIVGVMFSVLTASAVDDSFEPRSGQTKDYTIGICNMLLQR